MKSMKKMLSLLLAAISVSSLAACGGTGNTGNNGGGIPLNPSKEDFAGQKMSVICYEAGFGTKWLDEIADQFEEAYDVTVKVNKSYVSGELISLLNDNSTADDVVMALGSMFSAQDKGYLVDLSNVYNSIPEGNTKSVKDSMNAGVYNKLLTESGKIYQMNWADPVCGIILNKSVLNSIFPNGYEVPNTTDELVEFCNDIKTQTVKKVYPISVSTSISYWDYLHWVWWAQYEGYDSYTDYYYGYYHETQTDGSVVRKKATNAETLDQAGRLEAVKVAETLLKKSNGYLHKYADSMDWQEAQIAFVGQGYAGEDMTECAMMVNGEWLENEVQSYLVNKPQELEMIKTPVISSIVKTLENKDMTDETLSAVIDAIDAGETSYTGVSEKDFAKIKEARSMVYSATYDHCLCVPAKSQNKALAIEFLKFMASDLGQSIYAKHLNGLTMPYGTNATIGTMTNFVQSRRNNFKTFTPICLDNSSPLVYRQGLVGYTTGSGAGLESSLYAGKTAEWIINDTKTTLKASWSSIIAAAK